MVYQAFNSATPASRSMGPMTYHNPYFKTACGCGSGNEQVTVAPAGAREGFTYENMQAQPQPQHHAGAAQPHHQGQPQMGLGVGPSQPGCTLTATAPPAGCCHPAPLHCDCCNGSGYFRASEAYGS